jgi:hypothetical protein
MQKVRRKIRRFMNCRVIYKRNVFNILRPLGMPLNCFGNKRVDNLVRAFNKIVPRCVRATSEMFRAS